MKNNLIFRKVFPDSTHALYNVAAWQKSDHDNIVLVSRMVENPGNENTPDIGKLILFEIDQEGKIIHERLIWEPLHSSFYLEDPRALVLPNGNIVIGLTSVMRSEIGFEPFPAYTFIESDSAWAGKLPPITLIHTYGPGKNMTPVKKDTFMYRPESSDFHHRLLVFDINSKGETHSQTIDFPNDLDWAQWKIGTTMPPLWINENEALMIFHGITKIDNKYIYSIGRAKLTFNDGKYFVKVDKNALITPDTFTKDGIPLEIELHPKLRRVVYACGGVIKRNDPENLNLYVNVGDRTTYEVKLPLEELKEGLF